MKNRWFVTGDIHGDINCIIDFIEKFNLKEGDNIIVLGDVALAWRKDKSDYDFKTHEYERWCRGVHLWWIDGNHENFDIIKSWNYEKHGIYNNTEHIHYCSRGSILNINGKKALCIGGADSVDKMFRTKHLSWWEDETITDEDIEGITGHYDYVFTHCCPYSVFNPNRAFLCTLTNINENNAIHSSEYILDKLINNITYDKWYFGHYHVNKKLDDKHTCLFEDFEELEVD